MSKDFSLDTAANDPVALPKAHHPTQERTQKRSLRANAQGSPGGTSGAAIPALTLDRAGYPTPPKKKEDEYAQEVMDEEDGTGAGMGSTYTGVLLFGVEHLKSVARSIISNKPLILI